MSLLDVAPSHLDHEARSLILGNVESAPRFYETQRRCSLTVIRALKRVSYLMGDPAVQGIETQLTRLLFLSTIAREGTTTALIWKTLGFRGSLRCMGRELKQWRISNCCIRNQKIGDDLEAVLPTDARTVVLTARKFLERPSTGLLARRIIDSLELPESILWIVQNERGIPAGWPGEVVGLGSGTAPIQASDLSTIEHLLLEDESLVAIQGLLHRRLPLWLARLRYYENAIKRLAPKQAISRLIVFGHPQPITSICVNKWLGVPSVAILPLIEPTPSSRTYFATNKVLVTGAFQAERLCLVDPSKSVVVVGSAEAHNLITGMDRRKLMKRNGILLVLGKPPEKIWRTVEVLESSLRIAAKLGFQGVRYRGKPGARDGADIFGSQRIKNYLGLDFLQLANDGGLEDKLAEAGAIVTTTGNSFYLALLVGVPVLGYCFNEKTDLGESLIEQRLGFSLPVCRDIALLDVMLERVLSSPPIELPADVKYGLFGDLNQPVERQIVDALS